jgi:hypothetical protein
MDTSQFFSFIKSYILGKSRIFTDTLSNYLSSSSEMHREDIYLKNSLFIDDLSNSVYTSCIPSKF